MTVVESLSEFNVYPISVGRRELICIECGLTSEAELTEEISNSSAYKRATAKVYRYLAFAPNVSENGTSFSFTDADRKRFLSLADAIMEEIKSGKQQNEYGYKGEDL